MPAAITADWEAVRDTAVALQSIKLAAEKHEVPYEAARMRASREAWPVGRRLAKALAAAKQAHSKAIVAANPKAVASVTSTSDALISTLADRKDKSALHLSKYVVDASQRGANSNGQLELADDLNKVASIRSKVWPEEKQAGGFTLNLGILNQSVR